jgi:glyoxylase-like metal-dependent hydrolase (beta-lactamase superfamily II)
MTALRPLDGPWATPGEDLVGVSVADGVWITALPFPTPLRHSFSYLVETGAGLVVVDLGWDTDEGWQRLLAGLSRAGKTLDEVSGVVITHAHPDHYGLAARMHASSDAWIAMHPGERPQLAIDGRAARERIQDLEEWLVLCGAPASEVDCLHHDAAELAATFPSMVPDLDLVDGVPVGGDRGLVAVHTPGHTPGSTCFLDRERELIFTGDHVLPRITPNVSKRPSSDEDPLQDFTRSLGRLGAVPGAEELFVLPGHEWGFRDLGQRLAEIDEHHLSRLAELEAAVRSGHDTVWAVSEVVQWARPFESLSARARRSAIGETYSHLYRLHLAGRVRLIPGTTERWSPVPQ